MPTAITPPYPPREIAARGEALYAESIRARVEADNHGERLVIDIETGDFLLESPDDPVGTAYALLERNPNAVLYRLRIGYRAATKMGGSWRFAER